MIIPSVSLGILPVIVISIIAFSAVSSVVVAASAAPPFLFATSLLVPASPLRILSSPPLPASLPPLSRLSSASYRLLSDSSLRLLSESSRRALSSSSLYASSLVACSLAEFPLDLGRALLGFGCTVDQSKRVGRPCPNGTLLHE